MLLIAAGIMFHLARATARAHHKKVAAAKRNATSDALSSESRASDVICARSVSESEL